MTTPSVCPECGRIHPTPDSTCEADFHQMLYWENENPYLQVVHHLMVPCYHLQHPSLLSPDGLTEMIALLRAFLSGAKPEALRRHRQRAVSSRNRTWKITAQPGLIGSYPRLVRWTMTAGDVVARGPDDYIGNVWAWARSIEDSLDEMEGVPLHLQPSLLPKGRFFPG